MEEFSVRGKDLKKKAREIIKEGKARRIVIKKGSKVLADFPLAMGVGGAAAAVLLAPTIAAIGAIGALATDVTVVTYKQGSSSRSRDTDAAVWKNPR